MSGIPYYELLLAVGAYVCLLSFLYFALRFEPRLFALKILAFAFVVGTVSMSVSGGRLLARFLGSDGGLVFYGALLGGLAFCLLYAKATRTSAREILNRLVPGIALGHAVGRVGCFMEGCCYGSHCELPWAIQDPHTLMPVHPVQLYEAAGLLVLGLLLWKNEARRLKGEARPSTFGLYLLGYSTLRFVLEYFRGDLIRGIWGAFSTSQWISLAMLVVAAAVLKSSRDRPTPQA